MLRIINSKISNEFIVESFFVEIDLPYGIIAELFEEIDKLNCDKQYLSKTAYKIIFEHY